jgi:hypothetical protein
MDEAKTLQGIIATLVTALRPAEQLARGLGDALAATDLSDAARLIVAETFAAADGRRVALRTRLANLQDVLDTVNLYEPVPVPFASPAVLAELEQHLAEGRAAVGVFTVDP